MDKKLTGDNQKISQAKEKFITLIMEAMDKKLSLLEVYPDSDDLDKTLEQIEDLKKSLDSFRPLEGLNIEKLNSV